MLRATVVVTNIQCVLMYCSLCTGVTLDLQDIALVKDDFQDQSFQFQTVTGIGKEPGITRRDPSDVIRVGDTYFVYYTHVDQSKLALPLTHK